MIHSVVKHLCNLEQYGVASLCLFSAVFLGVLIFACIQKKSHLDYMARAALEPDPTDPQNTKDSQ
jgi:hypothetical protein